MQRSNISATLLNVKKYFTLKCCAGISKYWKVTPRVVKSMSISSPPVAAVSEKVTIILKRQSQLQQTTNFETSFPIFAKNKV